MRSIRSVVCKLVFAVCCYFVWQDRNYRLFKKTKRTPGQIIELIKSNVRLKLLSCSFKKTTNVHINAEQEKEPQGKAGTQVRPNQVWKPETEARSFQIAEGERSRKKNGVQKIEKGVFHRLGDKEKNVSAHSRGSERKSYYSSRRGTESCYQSSRSKETEIASFRETSPQKRVFTRNGSSVRKVWFDDLPKESIDSYDDLRKTLLENYIQQKKCIKDPVEIHNIKQRDGESTEEFVRRYKLEYMDVKGAPECMKIFGFMHRITNPELIKRLHDKIPKSMDEMMSVTTTFLRGEVAASVVFILEIGSRTEAKLQKGNFLNEQRTKRKQDRFTLLTKTPK
uniref:Reverse transcriptase domain-containing protein n=1 Tax=Tanacetum cinerariifolium TaxID=118510 RepID=A0A6L2MRF8_TANCI|nr:reverse transcriptase domain-containing protein [Tanacetum cinerariifolium]